MTRYTSATDADRREMLDAIGVGSVDDLFEQIPGGVRLGRALDLPDGMSEDEVNQKVADNPELVNEDPYGDGWLAKVKLTDPSEVDQLMDVNAYKELLSS